MKMKRVKLAIYESRAGGFFVHPEGQRFNTEARFATRAEAEAYILNPPPPERGVPVNIPGLEALGGKLAAKLNRRAER